MSRHWRDDVIRNDLAKYLINNSGACTEVGQFESKFKWPAFTHPFRGVCIYNLNKNPRADRFFSDLIRFSGFDNGIQGGHCSFFSLDSGFLGIPSGEASGDQSGSTYDGSNATEPKGAPSPIGGIFGGISSLPLGAKIGLTIVLTGLASCIWLWSFIRLLNGRSNVPQCLGAGILGVGLIAISGLFFW